jgi:hypothetical protein
MKSGEIDISTVLFTDYYLNKREFARLSEQIKGR